MLAHSRSGPVNNQSHISTARLTLTVVTSPGFFAAGDSGATEATGAVQTGFSTALTAQPIVRSRRI